MRAPAPVSLRAASSDLSCGKSSGSSSPAYRNRRRDLAGVVDGVAAVRIGVEAEPQRAAQRRLLLEMSTDEKDFSASVRTLVEV